MSPGVLTASTSWKKKENVCTEKFCIFVYHSTNGLHTHILNWNSVRIGEELWWKEEDMFPKLFLVIIPHTQSLNTFEEDCHHSVNLTFTVCIYLNLQYFLTKQHICDRHFTLRTVRTRYVRYWNYIQKISFSIQVRIPLKGKTDIQQSPTAVTLYVMISLTLQTWCKSIFSSTCSFCWHARNMSTASSSTVPMFIRLVITSAHA